jgi:peptidoglycan hydrolase-like protein with peptidoglycan-binding domain
MRLGNVLFGLVVTLCLFTAASGAHAQTGNAAPAPLPIDPLTGPSFPCPQPDDPLAQLVCSTPDLAQLDMQFVQAYEALYEQVGASGQPSVRHLDLQFDMGVRTTCGIGLSQASNPSPTPPPPAPSGAAACAIPLYQQQILLWKGMLQGAALEEANRPIQDQVALQTRLQTLGFLPAQAQMDGVFGTGTRAAIKQWQTSVGRPPTGLLAADDALALLGATASAGSNSSPATVPPGSLPGAATDSSAQTDAQPSSGNAPGNGPSVIPVALQGVWSFNCTASANAANDYIVFGPSTILYFSASGSESTQVVQFVAGQNSFAVSEDGSGTTNGSKSEPGVFIELFQMINANQISLFSDFSRGAGVEGGTSPVENKCSPNPAFSSGISQAATYVAPTPSEITDSVTMFSQMPPAMNIKWRP